MSEEKDSKAIDLKKRQEILQNVRNLSKEKHQLEKFKNHVLKLRKAQQYMEQNQNFSSYQGLDETTDFSSAKMAKKFLQILETKQRLE
jgi:hypothetical protein